MEDSLKNKTLKDLRGWAILGVLWIHATAPSISHENANIPLSCALIMINQISRYSVPLFFFISGYLYAKKKWELFNYKDHILRRIKTVGVPYLFWSSFYLSLNITIGDIQLSSLSIAKILTTYLCGTAYGHLYFVPALFQFYILLPLFLLFLERVKGEFPNRVALSVIIALALCLYLMRIHSIGSFSYIASSDWVIIWWLPFIMLGMLWDRCVNTLNMKFVASIILIVSFSLMNYEYISCYYKRPFYYTNIGVKDLATFLRPSALFYAISSIYLMIIIIQKIDCHSNVIGFLGKYSFGIYLLHPFVNKGMIYFIKSLGASRAANLYGSWILMLAGIPLAVICVVILSRIRGSHLIIGHNR